MKFKIVLVLSAFYSHSLKSGHSGTEDEVIRKYAVCLNIGSHRPSIRCEPRLTRYRSQARGPFPWVAVDSARRTPVVPWLQRKVSMFSR